MSEHSKRPADLKHLSRVSVDKPCPESWEEMVGNEKKRFCNKCSKHVHNLETYSAEEVEQLIREGDQGRACIRIPTTQAAPRKRLTVLQAAGAMAIVATVACDKVTTLGDETIKLMGGGSSSSTGGHTVGKVHAMGEMVPATPPRSVILDAGVTNDASSKDAAHLPSTDAGTSDSGSRPRPGPPTKPTHTMGVVGPGDD